MGMLRLRIELLKAADKAAQLKLRESAVRKLRMRRSRANLLTSTGGSGSLSAALSNPTSLGGATSGAAPTPAGSTPADKGLEAAPHMPGSLWNGLLSQISREQGGGGSSGSIQSGVGRRRRQTVMQCQQEGSTRSTRSMALVQAPSLAARLLSGSVRGGDAFRRRAATRGDRNEL